MEIIVDVVLDMIVMETMVIIMDVVHMDVEAMIQNIEDMTI